MFLSMSFHSSSSVITSMMRFFRVGGIIPHEKNMCPDEPGPVFVFYFDGSNRIFVLSRKPDPFMASWIVKYPVKRISS